MVADNSTIGNAQATSRSLLDMSADEARTFLLKGESYCGFDLPPYFQFEPLLSAVDGAIDGRPLQELRSAKACDCEEVNHLVLNNKDGRHAWRPLQLIHPALYVSLVSRMTEQNDWELICNRFGTFSQCAKIKCLSTPVESLTANEDAAEQVNRWWQQVEQASLELALDYECIVHTDIVDCYGDIYTHSIAWALHGKAEAKKRENRNNFGFIGNVIDSHIRDMRHGQTNGIPQGAVLMDFIAEMVLGYADIELAERIDREGINEFRILRYRDDYRIFVNSQRDGDVILKSLTEVLISLGLKLNPAKTKLSENVVASSLKEDKLAWICRRQSDESFQKHLLLIHNHGINYPNAGSLTKALEEFYKRVEGLQSHRQAPALTSIVVDIAYRNPRTYAICAAILSKLISFLDTPEAKTSVIQKTKAKFSKLPNTGHMEIWLQRISLPFAPSLTFDEPLCGLVCGQDAEIWNSEWIAAAELSRALDPQLLVNRDKVDALEPVVPTAEVALFFTLASGY